MEQDMSPWSRDLVLADCADVMGAMASRRPAPAVRPADIEAGGPGKSSASMSLHEASGGTFLLVDVGDEPARA
ncbi:hypothetical protein [Actinacidiphila sp. ITFR-21]|jgi:hypothetical protein|uniref:hypothetical protein n=1 Tax=Actinacidiphila sp. ITFR-21 TaxID=3075199 RepID=UPI00288B2686|nr:hypothetical protein [Streptomyces sp. ITFR-21]WNI20100.1 hypothetical protein RLT57_31670 [Streptomyces sp. ITFR-21]